MRRALARLSASRQNWKEVNHEVLAELRKAEFVALDLELTGLHLKNERFIGVERCYSAHREGAKTFLPVQVGLCAARRDFSKGGPESCHWVLSPVSLYVFPREAAVHSTGWGSCHGGRPIFPPEKPAAQNCAELSE
ncbi:unnamed protein product [Effrenium voratum]|nr:unnamed protein product [Effrenium voratum]